MATPRRPRTLLPAKKPNPLRDLVSQKSRALEAARERRRVQELKSELPSIIQERVGDQIDRLETRLLTEVREIGQRAMEEGTSALAEQLSGRIETLERVSALQTETLSSLRHSSEIADRKVSEVVAQIEQSLASVVPGFELDPPSQALRPAAPLVQETLRIPGMPVTDGLSFTAIATAATGIHPQFMPESVELVVAEPMDISEIVGRNGFCPNCTSVDVRRANRKGMFEEFLRLFSIAPFRCRACRHKFYRF